MLLTLLTLAFFFAPPLKHIKKLITQIKHPVNCTRAAGFGYFHIPPHTYTALHPVTSKTIDLHSALVLLTQTGAAIYQSRLREEV